MTNDKPLRFSALKMMAKSPAHYAAHLANQESGDDTDSRAMRLGRAVHEIVLGGQYDVFPGKDRRVAGYKEFERNAKSDTLLTEPEFYEAKRIAASVQGNKLAMESLSGVREKTHFTEYRGVSVRVTPDAFNVETGVLSDLKTTQSYEPGEFTRTIRNNHYAEQLSFYSLILGDEKFNTYRLVAVESASPFNVVTYNISLSAMQRARENVLKWFDKLLDCLETDSYPGYVDDMTVEYE